jgi:hypothetical protein
MLEPGTRGEAMKASFAILICIPAALPGGSSKAQTTTAPINTNPQTTRFGTLVVNDLITKNTPFVDVRAFGVFPSTTVDQSAAINKAIAHALANGYSRILLPSGQFLLKRPINLTNFNSAQLIGVGSALGYGEMWGKSQTRLICDTGTVCIDTNGSSNQLLENFTLVLGSTNPSTIGILQGRNSSTSFATMYSQFNKLFGITINFWQVNATANGGRGTIGVYNVGAEIATYELTYVISGEPFLLADTNILNVVSPYQATFSQRVPQSMTNVAFVNSFGTGVNSAAAGFLELDGHNTQNINLYATGSTGDSAKPGMPIVAIILRNNPSALRIHGGQWENYASFMSIYAGETGATDSLSIDTAVVGAGEKGMINLYANGHSSFFIVWSDVKIKQYPSQIYPFFGTVDSGANWRGGTLDIASSSGINSRNLALANVTIKASGLSSSSVSVREGSNYFLLANDGQRFVGGVVTTP